MPDAGALKARDRKGLRRGGGNAHDPGIVVDILILGRPGSDAEPEFAQAVEWPKCRRSAASPDTGRMVPAGALLSMVLPALIADATSALDLDHETTRALLRQAAILLETSAAYGLGTRPRTPATLAPWQASHVARYIDRHLDRPLLLSELAGIAELSNSYFSRAFKGTFGQTPHAFIIQRRVERARREMLEGHDPLSQIAVSCGFADQAHLARLFRRATGLAPSEWRRVNRPQSNA